MVYILFTLLFREYILLLFYNLYLGLTGERFPLVYPQQIGLHFPSPPCALHLPSNSLLC